MLLCECFCSFKVGGKKGVSVANGTVHGHGVYSAEGRLSAYVMKHLYIMITQTDRCTHMYEQAQTHQSHTLEITRQ